MHGKAEPERKATRTPRQVVRQIGRVPCLVTLFRLLQNIQVFRMLSVCIAGLFRVAINEGARVVRAEEPFVRIDDEAVGVFDAIELVATAWCAQSRRAVCTVNMKPCV